MILRALQAVNVCFTRIYHRIQVRTPCQLPRTGPAILVSNHISGLDPLLIQSQSRRLIVWMVAKEYYEIAGLRWIFRAIEAIPVQRGSRDIASTRQAMRALRQGRVLGIFPEGRIELARELLPFQTGVAMLAAHSGAAIYPAYVDGSPRGPGSMLSKFWRRQEAVVRFGPPLSTEFLRECGGLENATAAIQSAVQRLQLQN